MRAVRKSNFNTTNSVDVHIGDKHIANHFKQKFKTLFNSVGNFDNKISKLQTPFNNKVSIKYNFLPHVDDNDISHCHIVLKHDVRKAISNLKSVKIDEQGKFFF